MKHKFLEAFQGNIQPVKVQFYYKIALFLVAVMMLILPIIYFAMIIGIGFGVYYHATHSAYLFKGSGFGLIRIALYLAPIFSGAILLFFMIKPLFTKWGKLNTINLERNKEPLLFAFVEEICKRVGASTPRRIEVNCDVNAMASFRRGLLSFFGSDLTLTIGMSLVAGINLQQFAGVLAHEFGHFTQGTAMRFSYVIQSINAWFVRFVTDKDYIDNMLDRWAEDKDYRIGIILWIAKLCVWITNQILRGLMFIGSMISFNLLRQMEFDADRYEIQLAGSEAFVSTFTRIHTLNAAYQNAFQELYQSYTENKLVNDIPCITQAYIGKLPEDIDTIINESIAQQKTGKFDTHPSDYNRIQNAKQQNAKGIFHLQEPAPQLFTDFENISQEVTNLFYLERFGADLKSKKLVSASDLVAEQYAAREEEQTLTRYFMNILNINMTIELDLSEINNTSKDSLIHTIKQSRHAMMQNFQKAQQALEQLEKSEAHRIEAMQAKAILNIGFQIDAKEFHLSDNTIEAAEKEIKQAKDDSEIALSELDKIITQVIIRLQSTFQLLKLSNSEFNIENSKELTDEFLKLNLVLNKLTSQFTSFLKLRDKYFILIIYLNNIKGHEKDEDFNLRTLNILKDSYKLISSMKKNLAGIAYPFDYAGSKIDVDKYLLEKLPYWENFESMYNAIVDWLDRYASLYYRVLGRLAFIAESVEKKLGLEPLEVVAKRETKIEQKEE